MRNLLLLIVLLLINTNCNRSKKDDESFTLEYISHKSELTVQIKEEWRDNEYVHLFKLTDQEIKAIVYYLKRK